MKQQRSNRLIIAGSCRPLCLSLAGALMMLLTNRANAQVSYAGEQAGIQGWRSTSETKTLDPDGNNAYGSAGYLMIGTTAISYAGSGNHSNVGDDLYTWNTSANINSIPGYLSVDLASTVNGTYRYYYGYGTAFTYVDDPTQSISANVSDLRSGILWKASSGDLLTLTLGAGFPTSGLRVGVLTDNETGSDVTPTSITITGPGNSATANPGPNSTVGNFDGYFFDITGNAGDVFTISETGSGNVSLAGLSFDVVPEPSTLALVGVGGLLFLLSRRMVGGLKKRRV